MAERGENEGARTIGRVLKVFELLAGAQKPLRLVDVSKALNVPASSAHALLQQLVKYNYIQMLEDRRYSQSSGLVVLASRVLSGVQLTNIARPFLDRLSGESGESIYLGMRTPQGIVYVDSIEATYGLVSRVPLGSLRPLHASSSGRVFLAFGVQQENLDTFLGPNPLVAYTSHTPVDKIELRRLLKRTRSEGCAVNEQAMIDKVYGVSAPIFDARGSLSGTLTLSGPDTRFIPKREFLIQSVKDTAAAISRAAGLDNWEQTVATFAKMG